MKKLIFLLFVVSLVLASALPDLERPALSQGRTSISNPRREEKTAPFNVRATLYRVRRQMQQAHLTYSVGYTPALDFDLKQITGAIPPRRAQLEALAAAKTTIAVGAMAAACQADRFDLRADNGGVAVSPVRDQGECGSCWAFASIAALEGSWGKTNNVPHGQIDMSEQRIVDCTLADYGCGGGWHGDAFDQLTAPSADPTKGTVDESEDPYQAANLNSASCGGKYQAKQWDYVRNSAGQLPTPGSQQMIDAIKAALCAHGPIATGVIADSNFQAYTGGIFKGAEGTDADVNHEVTIIGWDEPDKAWIVKNSWGTGWGETAGFGTEGGYMYIGYQTNMIGYGAAWIDAKAGTVVLNLNGILQNRVITSPLMQSQGALSAGSADGAVVVTEADRDKTVRVPLGGTLTVQLKERPGTPFYWHIDSINTGYLSHAGQDEHLPGAGMPGGEQVRVMKFMPQQTGTTVLRLVNRRDTGTPGRDYPAFQITISIE